MMKRPGLSRPFCVSMLAIACLLVLSYFPLSRIRAASAGATILPSAGKPLVNLKTPQNLKLTYVGPADAVATLQAGTAIPTALSAADFDADGAMDVVAGYSTKNGGVLVLMRGNPDAYAPTDLTLYGKAAKGNVPPTFLSKATIFAVPESPDLIATGDFNRDGYKDVLVASRGGALYLLAGDGHGNLVAPKAVPLPGNVTALAVTPDGHVAVSTDGPNGPQLAMLAPGAEGLTAGAIYPLPARGDAIEWGRLGGGADLAVGAGANVVIFYNALATNPQTETVAVPFQVKGLALGDFIWDRDGRTEIAVLADDGSIHILQHGPLNTAPLTAAELPARQAAIRGHHTQPATRPNPTDLGAWSIAKQLPYTGSAPSGPVSPSAFNSPRLASSSTQDLMVLDAAAGQLHILDTSGTAASPSAGVSFTGTPVAALALPGKIDSGRDIVVLTSSQSAPMLVPTGSSFTLNVNTTADIDSISACTTNTTTIPSTLSLREAVCLANNLAPDTTTINVPPGTYSLTSLETGELRQGVTGTGVGVSYSLTINGTGTAVLIQQTDGVDRILEEDFNINGNNPVTIQNVTLHAGNCTNTTTNDCQFAGGAILAGSVTGDDLTLTNAVLSNNGANPSGTGGAGAEGGGAIEFDTPPNLTITNSGFFSNSASGAGGAIEFKESGNGGGNLSVTNSTFTSNTAVIDGGGISMVLATGFSATISGSTFNSNSVTEPAGTGGGIFAEQSGTVTVSNSRFVLDSAPGGGTGATMAGSTAGTLINNWWGCNGGPTVGNTGVCDTVLATGGGTASFDPWLVLSLSANPTQVDPGGTSTLTADLTHNSSGGSGFSAPNGTPVTFFASGTLGTVNPTTSTLTSGQATSTYTAGSTAGNDYSVTATVDNATAGTTIDILDSVTFNTSPTGLSYSVDGITYTTQQTFNWVVNSSHSVSTTSPQPTGSLGSQYSFFTWSDGGAISHSVTAPSAATTYAASFNLQYQLSTQASPPADGSVTPVSGGYFNAGSAVPITATANAGFAFNNWTSSPDTVASPTSASTTITMNAPETVTANFVPSTVQVTVGTSPSGLAFSVDGTGYTSSQTLTWAPGSTHTIATSSPQTSTGTQYSFVSWSDGGAMSHMVTASAGTTSYTASFSVSGYLLSTGVSPTGGGTVAVSPPSSNGYYAPGTIVKLTATANTGYSFSHWTGTRANTNNPMNLTMNAPITETANFKPIQVSVMIDTSPSGLLVSVDHGAFKAAPVSESWAFGSMHTIATQSPQGSNGTRYLFSSWSDGGAESHSVTIPATSTTYTAAFSVRYQLTTAVSPAGGGTVAPVSGHYFAAGAVANLEAKPASGYVFDSWTGNVANPNAADTTITMNGPQSVTANFRLKQ